VQTVAQRIGAENVNLSGGRLEQGAQRYLVRTVNEFKTLDAMADAVIATVDERPVRLRDVATVTRAYKERTAITRYDGRECIELALYKEGDANTVQLAAAVTTKLEQLRKSLPADSELRSTYDQSRFISNAVGEVRDAAIWGGLLAVFVLYFFLRDARATLVASIVIPVTVIGIFVAMYGFKLTLNVMSLGGIALSIGMLIDNSVVILEAIARKREKGLPAYEAARDGTAEVAMAVTASTLTTVAVFFPLVFVSGIAGQLFRDQALTVTFAQLLSLLASLTLVPMLAAWRARDNARNGVDTRRSWTEVLGEKRQVLARTLTGLRLAITTGPWWARPIALLRSCAGLVAALAGIGLLPFVHGTQRLYHAANERYPGILRQALAHRGAVAGGGLLLLALTAAATPWLRTELIPQLAQGEFSVRTRLEAGAPLASTDRVMRDLQAAASKLPGVDRSYAVAGTGNRLDANPVDSGENVGEIAVTLHQPAGATEEQAAMSALRRTLEATPGVQFEFKRPALFTLATPVEIVLSGYELQRLSLAAQTLRDKMQQSGAFDDLRSSIEGGHPEIQISFDQERASQLGLQVRDIADRVVASVRGDVATRYRWRDRKIDVLVRSIDARDATVEDVRSLIVNPGADKPVTLAAVADVRLATGPAEIRRANQERVAILSASPAGGNLGHATAVARQLLNDTPLPPGITATVTGQSEEMSDSFRSLLFAFGLAVFLVYLVMASQFESLLHPFVILFTIPMGLIGAVWALLITGISLNAVAIIGLILLAGIVVNNAIVLVDAINQARRTGLPKMEAIVVAGQTRLRPILITSISTILGLLPMALALGEGAEIRRPMAVTIIGGMLVATFMTLIVIPVLYSLLDRAPRREPGRTAAVVPA
jgi:HAE1 family hydrophobic/amphiphilic exporter-1